MPYDESDAARDAYMERLFQEFYESEGPQIAEEAIAGFQDERLQSYFIANPMLIEPAQRQLTKARAFFSQGEYDAALVFAASALEVGLKYGLFRPIVYGLVRDRLLLSRELLTESGSVFVQISDENVHHVRELMDEVFWG